MLGQTPHSLFLLPSLMLSCLLISCATLMPASEGLIFTEQQENYDFNDSGFTSNLSGAEVMQSNTYILPFQSLVQALNDKFGQGAYTKLDNAYLRGLALPSFTVFYKNRLALGSTVPFPGFWQVDATVRVFNQYYITVSRKIALNNTQIIFQRRLIYHNKGGVSLGVFYRYDPLELKRENNRFYISWYGLRSVFQTPAFSNPGYHLRGFINAGYVPKLDKPLIAFGISLVFSIHR